MQIESKSYILQPKLFLVKRTCFAIYRIVGGGFLANCPFLFSMDCATTPKHAIMCTLPSGHKFFRENFAEYKIFRKIFPHEINLLYDSLHASVLCSVVKYTLFGKVALASTRLWCVSRTMFLTVISNVQGFVVRTLFGKIDLAFPQQGEL